MIKLGRIDLLRAFLPKVNKEKPGILGRYVEETVTLPKGKAPHWARVS